jgi:hypothetical protein
LTAAIPSGLGNVSNLRSLDLRYNQLSGTIPSELGDLLNLWSLDLRSNELTGTLPTALGDLANLRDLLLNGNQLSGTIPPELGDLLNLQTLYLAGNQLTGTIPTELGNLANLVSLYLGHNQLTGAIPSELGNLSNLQYLDLHGNQLAGVVPSTLVNLVNLQWAGGLEIGWNALHTTDPILISFLDAKQGGDWQSTQTVAPTGLVPSSPTSSSINLSWTPITYTGDTGGYEARYATSPGGPYTDFVPPTSDKSVTSMTVNGLSADTTYHFVVRTFTNPHTNNSGTVVSENSLEVTLATLP